MKVRDIVIVFAVLLSVQSAFGAVDLVATFDRNQPVVDEVDITNNIWITYSVTNPFTQEITPNRTAEMTFTPDQDYQLIGFSVAGERDPIGFSLKLFDDENNELSSTSYYSNNMQFGVPSGGGVAFDPNTFVTGGETYKLLISGAPLYWYDSLMSMDDLFNDTMVESFTYIVDDPDGLYMASTPNVAPAFAIFGEPQGNEVPEPGMFGLVALGGMMLVGRRGRKA